MKSDTTDTAVKEKDIVDIKQRQIDIKIYRAWQLGNGLRELARQMDMTIGEVKQRLKVIEKEKVEHGVENHGDENNT